MTESGAEKRKRPWYLRPVNIAGMLAVTGIVVFLFLLPGILKDLAEKEGSEITGRRLTIGGLSLNYWQGSITVDDLRLAGQNKDHVLLEFKRLRVDIDVWALFNEKISVEGLELASPKVFIERIQADQFSISDLLARFLGERPEPAKPLFKTSEEKNSYSKAKQKPGQDGNQAQKPKKNKKQKKGKPGKKRKGSGLALADIRLKNFSFLFLDKALDEEIKFTIHSFVFRLDRIDLDKIFESGITKTRYWLSGLFLGSNLRVDGTIGLGNNRFELKQSVRLDDLEMEQSAHYFPLFALFRVGGGKLNARAEHKIAGELGDGKLKLDSHTITGDLALDQLVMAHSRLGAKLRLGEGKLSGWEVDLLKNSVNLGAVNLQYLRFPFRLDSKGRINIASFFKLRPDENEQALPEPQEASGEPPWEVKVEKLRTAAATFSFLDESRPDLGHKISVHYLRTAGFSVYPLRGIYLTTKATVEPSGKQATDEAGMQVNLFAQGAIRPRTLWSDFKIRADGLSLPRAGRYLSGAWSFSRGTAGLEGRLRYSRKKGLEWQGTTTAENGIIMKKPATGAEAVEVYRFGSLAADWNQFRVAPNGIVNVLMSAKVDKYVPVSVKLSGDLEKFSRLSLQAGVTGGVLPRFNYFIRSNSGYRIAAGTLDLDVNLDFKDGNGLLKTKIGLNKPEVQVADPAHPNQLPVDLDLAVDMLKDDNGRIAFSVDVPLDKAEPDLGNVNKVITRFVLKFLKNAVLAPFKAVAKLTFGDGGKLSGIDFYPVRYELNSAKPEADGLERLQKLGVFLQNHKRISINYLSRASAGDEFGYHEEAQTKIIKVKVKKPATGGPGGNLPGGGAGPGPGGGGSTGNGQESTGQGNGQGADSVSPSGEPEGETPAVGAEGSAAAESAEVDPSADSGGSEAVLPPGYIWVEKEVTEIVTVPNSKPDIKHITELLDQRNTFIKSRLVEKYGIAPGRLGVKTVAPSNVDEMNGARTEFSLWR